MKNVVHKTLPTHTYPYMVKEYHYKMQMIFLNLCSLYMLKRIQNLSELKSFFYSLSDIKLFIAVKLNSGLIECP